MTDRPVHVQNQMEGMLQQIKSLEPVLGKGRVRSFATKTLNAQVKKGVITQLEYDELMSRLGYDVE